MQFISYLFETSPGAEFLYFYPLLGLIAFLIIASIVASVVYKKKKKHDFAYKRLFKSLSPRLLLMGLLFLLLLGVRYENIPYFSMRIWIYLSLILLAYIAYVYIKIARVQYPKEKQNVEHKVKHSSTKEENKYLPNKKKRK
ncbi:hypothetical protein HN709_04195 [Candidatus Peregrinibacteria bacterium]|jgi:uncharacterized membrane protein|nr:hypothetical protein [Candidatus Peregrinibacteria bacterium]MBT7736864.1 hypothetical protein [Candidatus Peregrinibacteria bacterium]